MAARIRKVVEIENVCYIYQNEGTAKEKAFIIKLAQFEYE